MITQVTKTCYDLERVDLPLVIERLHVLGYADAPHWYMKRGGFWLFILPQSPPAHGTFRLHALPCIREQYRAAFAQLPIAAFVMHLERSGWQGRYSRYLIGQQSTVLITKNGNDTGPGFWVEVDSLRPEPIQTMMRSIGHEQEA